MVKHSHTAAQVVDAEINQEQQQQQNNPDISDTYAQQQMEQQAYGSIPSVQFQKNQSEIIKLLKIPDYLDNFELRLKGLSVDWATQTMIKKGEPLMDDVGAELFLSVIHSCCNNIVTMCTLKPEKISDCFYQQSQSIQDFIYYNYKKYNIKKENWDIIFNQARMLTLAALNRTSSDGINDKVFLQTTERHLETVNTINGGQGMNTGMPRRSGIGGIGKFLSFVRGGEEQ